MAAVALVEQGRVADAQLELLAVMGAWPGTALAEAAQITLADAYMGELPQLAVTHYRAYLSAHPAGEHRARASTQIAYGLARDGYFQRAAEALAGAGVDAPASLTAALAHPPRWARPGVAGALSALQPRARPRYARLRYYLTGVFSRRPVGWSDAHYTEGLSSLPLTDSL